VSIIISDTSPIRALAHVKQLDLLKSLFGEVLVPPAVAQELERPRPTFAPIQLAEMSFLKVQAPHDLSQVRAFERALDRGELEAIALALELGATALLIDERSGRNAARRVGLETIGALGILVWAKQAGLVSAVRPLLDSLQLELNFFISDRIREAALRSVGE
jgi:predicted nucleic acid-binding protein